MSADRLDAPTPEEARAREALRVLERPRLAPAFRERLKRDFAAGRIGEGRALVLPVAWHRRPAWRLALVSAVAGLLAVTVLSANRGSGWTVMATRGDGVAIVDLAPVPLGHREDLAHRLRPGARLTVPTDGEVELASASGLVVQVTAGTEFTLPAVPGRWFGRRVRAAVRHGEIRVTTGSAFHGARLRVAIVMHDYQGMGHDEIAAATGVNHAAVRKRYSRALAALAGLLKGSLG